MQYPTSRSRKSGEYAILQYVPMTVDSSGTIMDIIGATFDEFSESSGKLAFTLDVTTSTWNSVAVGDTIVIIGVNDTVNGYHTVTVVNSATSIETATAITAAQVELANAASDDARVFRVQELSTTGQATDISGGGNVSTDTITSIGNVDVEEVTSTSDDVSLSLYVDDAFNIARLYAEVESASPHNVKPVVKLNHTLPYHTTVFLVTLDSRDASAANILYTTVYEYVKWTSDTPKTSAGKSNYNMIDLSGKAKRRYVIKPR